MRNWQDWPKRFNEKITGTSGMFGVLTTVGGGFGGLLVSAATAGYISGGLAVGSAAVCGLMAIPPKQRSPQDAIGEIVENLDELGKFSPPLRRVGFVGLSRAGKTTLLNHVIAHPAPPNTRTDEPYAVVSLLPGRELRYFALIDAAGQQYAQQFKVANEAESLIICLDHTPDNRTINVDQARLREHETFIDQMLGHIRIGKAPLAVHLLLNKRDLWQNGSADDELNIWLGQQVTKWKSLPSIRVTSSRHSNFVADDTTAFIEQLRKFLA